MKQKGYTEIEAPQVIGGRPNIYNKAYMKGDLRIWITRDLYNNNELRWHMSISCAHRYPVWDEIRDARYALMPDDITVAMFLPPKSEYVNLHPNCFHLHEVMSYEG
jgi:hypothetical protein